MVNIKDTNEIILNMIDLLRLTQPNATTMPGSVIRDLVIDLPASQLGLLYGEISNSSIQQSLRLVSGSDLDKLAKNFGITRKTATAASGVALLTFNTLQGTITINKGDTVISQNGFSFMVLNGVAINPAQANFYRSVATKNQNDLTFVGITDQYAVEVTVQATTVGVAGNISKYALAKTSISGISNVTNTQAFTGGANQEDDATFRNRILSIFSGASVGTALGYKNTALSVTGVQDAYVVQPNDPLMTRDGTITTTDNQGNITIVSEGTGGKVDVVILGSDLTENIDSFIYQDKSNKNDPTASQNNVVLGQIAADANKTINQKRLDDIANGTLPSQPVENILQVTGSVSGANFAPKTVDQFGVVSGNYELLKDTGTFAGSPWGLDALHWIDNRIRDFQEAKVKGKFNGQDATTFPDVLEIPSVQQNIAITNENSTSLSSNRSLIQLLHTPATNVTRVFNVNTGERYTVINQNFGGTGSINTAGVIQISGNTLPSPSDVLQVDYTWIVSFDQYADYDGRLFTNNPRPVTDSVDWGYSNAIRFELVSFSLNTSSTLFVGNTSLPISSVISTNVFKEVPGVVTQVTSGAFAGRLSVVIGNLATAPNTVDNIFFKHTFDEVYKTAQRNGSFSVSSEVVGFALQYVATIILPTDTKANIGDAVSVYLDTTDLFNIISSTGSFNNTQISIPAANITTSAHTLTLKVVYIANTQTLLSANTTSLPASRISNGFLLGSAVGFNNNNVANISRREFQPVQLNLSNQLFIELSLSSNLASLTASQVLSVIRLSDGKELWNADNVGTVIIGTDNNYQLILSGYNSPQSGDRALIVYYANDTADFQPFTFQNQVIERDFVALQSDVTTNSFVVPLHNFISETSVHFQILEPNTDIILASASDGYIVASGTVSPSALFGSNTTNFSAVLDSQGNVVNITSKQIRILNPANRNNGNVYDILAHDLNTDSLTIGNDFSKISKRQISIVRLLDGQELWSDAGTIDFPNNRVLFPISSNATVGDSLLLTFYRFNNLHQAATKLSVNITDQVVNTGVMTFSGTTITKATDVLLVATASGLKQSLLAAYKTAVGLNSNAVIPSNVQLVKLAKLEKVTTSGSAGTGEVLTVLATYDVDQSTIKDNTYFIENSFSDPTLTAFDVVLPATTNNTQPANQPKIGDTLRVTFYFSTAGDTENVSFTRNGTLYTNKLFGLINKIYISSGFNISKSAKLTLNNFNQPLSNSRYNVFYDYLAPKINERITIRYNTNKLIADTTFAIENSRPINADVIVREAKQILVNVTMGIIVSSQSLTSAPIILQNVKNSLIAAINATSLGTSLDASKMIDTAFSVSGVAGARIIQFNVAGQMGQVLSINAHNDQYLVANLITVNQETS